MLNKDLFKKVFKSSVIVAMSLMLALPSTVHAEDVAETTTEVAVKPVVRSGWVKENNNWYYYNPKTHAIERNKITGNVSGGYFYVDNTGARVNDEVVNYAVKFVRSNTKSSWSNAKKLKTCAKKLMKKHKFKNDGSVAHVNASQMRGYAQKFFKKKKGNCYSHAASMCYIAKVLGYNEVRVGSGYVKGHYSRDKSLKSDHGWCEVKKGKKWYVFDLTFGRRYPKKRLVDVPKTGKKKKRYQYKLKAKKNFVLSTSNGVATWR